jgi:replicative DNA helicase
VTAQAEIAPELDGGYLPAGDIIPAEQVVVGSAISSRRMADELGDVVRPEHFWRPAHQVIYGAALRLAEAGQPVDPVAVLSEITRAGDLGVTGGAGYLHTCLARASAASAGYHARRVAGDFRRRLLNVAATRIQQMTGEPGFDLESALEEARALIDGVSAPSSSARVPSMADLTTRVLDGIEKGKPRGVPAGLGADLDAALAGGYVAGQLILIAARPGAGKSIALAQTAMHVARSAGAPVLLSSLEMTDEEITTRIIAAEAKVNLMSLLTRQVSDGDWDRIARAHDRIAGSPLRIDHAPGCSLAHIRSRLRGLARDGGARMLAVDYLQLLDEPRGSESRQAAVAANTRALKNLAGELGIPVVAAVQLNRNSERRSSKRPELADLRESGELEQAADVVILLHREDMYERESPRAGEMDLIIAKNRQGPTTTVTVAFQGHYSRIVDMARLDWTASSVLGASA